MTHDPAAEPLTAEHLALEPLIPAPLTPEPLTADRLGAMKWAYTTGRVPRRRVHGLSTTGRPCAGDVVVARVMEIGQHKRLESVEGRKQMLFPGDEILLTYANRYAPAQYEAVVPDELGPCDLVAAGGVAATALSWHVDFDEPTRIDVIGFATDAAGSRINLADHRLPAPTAPTPHRPYTVIVAGTSMDSGKTTTAAGLIRGLVHSGFTVGAAKVTGTGAGGDGWLMTDAGASPVLDFTAVGMASTYLAGLEGAVDSLLTLHHSLASAGVDVAVIEVADGLYQQETRALLESPQLAAVVDGVVFAAGDAAGAVCGVAQLREMGLPVVAVSGLLTASPLATREARAALDLPVLDLEQLWGAAHSLRPGAVAAIGASGLGHEPLVVA